uniref:Glycosyltransferase 2-like domain-containing protein n=1 Tax=Cereibacter sphaeroides (strain ATCC 17025 / ATH 2.4.3) TaxID=349102 RepID=A4WZP1_CERS5
MNRTARICAVVVTYNRIDQMQKTVARLLEEPIDHLVVVDNGSSDGSRDWLRACTDPRLELLEMARNIGGAGGFETGLRHVVSVLDPDWIVLMDDDARPEPGCVAMFRAADKTGWDAIAAAVFFPDGRICSMNRPVLNPFWHPRIFLRTLAGGGRAAFHLTDRDYDQAMPQRVDGGSFVGLFLARRAVEVAGYPDGRLFVYAEDGLYSLAISGNGGRVGFFPQLRFEHECSTFSASGQFTPIWKVYFYHRNLLLLYRRAAGIWFWPALLAVLPKWVLRGLRQKGERLRFLRLLGWAVRDGLTRRVGWTLDDLQQEMRRRDV